MKWKYLLLSFSMLLALPAWSNVNKPSQPEKCPSAALLNFKNMKSEFAHCRFDNTCPIQYGFMHLDTPDTPAIQWELFVWVNDTARLGDIFDAVRKARNSLQTITFKSGPYQLENGNWMCEYNNELGYLTHLVKWI